MKYLRVHALQQLPSTARSRGDARESVHDMRIGILFLYLLNDERHQRCLSYSIVNHQ